MKPTVKEIDAAIATRFAELNAELERPVPEVRWIRAVC